MARNRGGDDAHGSVSDGRVLPARVIVADGRLFPLWAECLSPQRAARRFSAGSSVGPLGTAQDFKVPPTSSRRS